MKTVSLELSKQLKAAGYPQEDSQFYWSFPTNIFGKHLPNAEYFLEYDDPDNGKCEDHEHDYIASPLADEIYEKLHINIVLAKRGNSYLAQRAITGDISSQHIILFEEKSLADAAAKMWLYLKENNLLEEEG